MEDPTADLGRSGSDKELILKSEPGSRWHFAKLSHDFPPFRRELFSKNIDELL